MTEFTELEKLKLKQLVCEHTDTKNHSNYSDSPLSCACCGQYDQKCIECKKIIYHECNDHDTDDGYCNNCR